MSIRRVAAPVTCHLSPPWLPCWFTDELASRPRLPRSGLWGCDRSRKGDAELNLRRSLQVWRAACLCHRRTWGPFWEAAFSHHPVLGFSSLLQEFPIEALTANSTGVVRQPVTQTETEVSPQRLSLFYWQRLLALLRGIPCCLRWVAVENGVNVKYWNLPSTSSDY